MATELLMGECLAPNDLSTSLASVAGVNSQATLSYLYFCAADNRYYYGYSLLACDNIKGWEYAE